MAILTNRVLLLFFLSTFLGLLFIRVNNYQYSIDAQNLYDTARVLIDDHTLASDEILENSIKIDDKYYPAQPIGYSIISIPSITFFRLEPYICCNVFLNKDWHIVEKTKREGIVSWMGENATLYVINPSNNAKKIKLSFIAESYRVPRPLIIHLNDGDIKTLIVGKPDEVELYMSPKPGLNKIFIESLSGCDTPQEIENSTDTRCLSISLRNLRLLSSDKQSFDPVVESLGSIIFENGFYEIDSTGTIWANQSARITYLSDKDSQILMNFLIISNNKSRNLKIKINDDNIVDLKIKNTWRPPPPLILNLKKGVNIIDFISSGGCSIPKNDSRCISFGIQNLTYTPVSGYSSYEFSDGFYEQDSTGVVWANQSARITYLSSNDSFITFDSIIASYKVPKSVSVYANNKLISIIDAKTEWSQFPTQIIKIDRGLNVIEFRSDTPCFIPVNDKRCVSIGFQNISLNSNLMSSTLINVSNGWFDLEFRDTNKIRWMSNRSEIMLKNPLGSPAEMKTFIIVQSYHKNRTLSVSVGDKHMGTYEIPVGDKTYVDLMISLEPKKNTLFFNSEDGCDTPNNVENATDNRCLSFVFYYDLNRE
ncbi:MAG: hypothetical protein J4428_05420 [Candidatus Aenigmarchaeota archaeon]|nr:hypothetical protein [Candidatus Aenigmarchaeota archaeon]